MQRHERGYSLVEILAVVLLLSFLVMSSGIYGINLLRKERQRGAAYQLYSQVGLARVEAAKRNRDCRVTIDTSTRIVRVLDLNDPASSGDDVELGSATLDAGIVFARPDGFPAVTLAAISGTTYGTTFRADGSVGAGSGEVGFASDTTFQRLAIYAGGAVSVERWTGSAWVTGS